MARLPAWLRALSLSLCHGTVVFKTERHYNKEGSLRMGRIADFNETGRIIPRISGFKKPGFQSMNKREKSYKISQIKVKSARNKQR